MENGKCKTVATDTLHDFVFKFIEQNKIKNLYPEIYDQLEVYILFTQRKHVHCGKFQTMLFSA